ncbi:hypothetical protein AB0G74_08705 [Streptomyces sp. NPDC020875]|uniref:hypothetical protein n=1 Tax=Streptomyces sp. NPDC020875 TaxID=3154898 RepID=UPI0033EA9560
MIVKRIRPKAVVSIAAAAMALGALSAAPAQADTVCNSGRLCYYQPNGNITNVGLSTVTTCGASAPYPGAIGNNYVRNRSATYWVDLYYDYNGDGDVTPVEHVVRLYQGDGATLNASSRYYYCKI